jgi:hypothetical protein
MWHRPGNLLGNSSKILNDNFFRQSFNIRRTHLNLHLFRKSRIVFVQLLSNAFQKLFITCIIVDRLLPRHLCLLLLCRFFCLLFFVELYDVKLNEFFMYVLKSLAFFLLLLLLNSCVLHIYRFEIFFCIIGTSAN